jgi:hypothetical protein
MVPEKTFRELFNSDDWDIISSNSFVQNWALPGCQLLPESNEEIDKILKEINRGYYQIETILDR